MLSERERIIGSNQLDCHLYTNNCVVEGCDSLCLDFLLDLVGSSFSLPDPSTLLVLKDCFAVLYARLECVFVLTASWSYLVFIGVVSSRLVNISCIVFCTL